MKSCSAMFVLHIISSLVGAAAESTFLEARRSGNKGEQESVITCEFESVDDCFVQALAKDGVVIVNGVPGLPAAREAAFHSLAACAANQTDKSMERDELDDGTVLQRLVTHTIGGTTEPFDTNCQGMPESAHALREVVDAASYRVLRSLESLVRPGEPVLRADVAVQHKSLLSVVAHGEQKEHFHAYWKPTVARATAKSENTSSPAAVEMHTEVGMLISMVPAMLVTLDGQIMFGDDEAGLYVKLASGSLARVAPTAPDAMLFMVGSGWVDWINPSLLRPLRAAPHKLIMPRTGDAVRCWYGRMYVPAAGTELPPHQLLFAGVRSLKPELRPNESIPRANFLPTSPSCV